MTRKTQKTALVIIPPAETWPPIQAIRRVHDRQYRRWMPHITLIYPFRPIAEFSTLCETLAPVCNRLASLEITSKPSGSSSTHIDPAPSGSRRTRLSL